MDIVALTDINWVNTIRENPQFEYYNFWTPTPWNIKIVKPCDTVYFLLKKEAGRKICGYGKFYNYENLNAKKAWAKFGKANGVDNYLSLTDSINKYIKKNTSRSFDNKSAEIGCIVLKDVTLFNEVNYIVPEDLGFSVPFNVVKYKSVETINGNMNVEETSINKFVLVTEEKKYEMTRKAKREGQYSFRLNVLKKYNNMCCITKMSTFEAIDVAHIQEYISKRSNNIYNGIPLRKDLHALFDSGLMTIDGKLIVQISKRLMSTEYKSLHGVRIYTPNISPSAEALEWHKKNVFIG